MKIKVQLVVCAEDGREEQVQEIAMVEKPHQQIEHLCFTLAEAKSVLKMLQQHLVEQQATAFVAAHAQCEHCGNSSTGPFKKVSIQRSRAGPCLLKTSWRASGRR